MLWETNVWQAYAPCYCCQKVLRGFLPEEVLLNVGGTPPVKINLVVNYAEFGLLLWWLLEVCTYLQTSTYTALESAQIFIAPDIALYFIGLRIILGQEFLMDSYGRMV